METVFAGKFNRAFGNFLKRLVFEKGDGNWVDVLPTVPKHYNKRKHCSTKLNPIEAQTKERRTCPQNLLHKRQKLKPKFKIGDSVRRTSLRKTFSESNTTNWF